MKFIHDITGAVLTWAMNNKYILMTLNILLPVAIYFEAGPVAAFTTYFGFFLVVSMAMSISKEEQKKEAMDSILTAALKDAIKSSDKSKTTEFETEEFEGSITEIHKDDLPEELQEMLKKQETENEPTKH